MTYPFEVAVIHSTLIACLAEKFKSRLGFSYIILEQIYCHNTLEKKCFDFCWGNILFSLNEKLIWIISTIQLQRMKAKE